MVERKSKEHKKERYETVLPATPIVKESWCREGVREGTQGYQLRLETAPVLLCRFLITRSGAEKYPRKTQTKGHSLLLLFSH